MAQAKPNISQITHPSIPVEVPSLSSVGMVSSAANQEKNQEQVAKLFGEPRAKQQKLGFLKIDKETQAMKEQVEVEKLHQANGVFFPFLRIIDNGRQGGRSAVRECMRIAGRCH